MKKRHALFLVLSTLILLPVLLPFLRSSIPFGWDSRDHIVRMAAFHKSILDGEIPPRWSSVIAYGFGSPVLMFNWSLPYYIAEPFLFLGMSLVSAFKSVVVLTTIASFASMFLLVSLLCSPYIALASASFYVWAPYYFSISNMRGAIGETTAFVFWPLTFWVMLLFFKKRYWQAFFLAPVIWALLVLSHQGLFLMILPVFSVFTLLVYFEYKNKKALIYTILSFLLGIALPTFFWLPAFVERTTLQFSFLFNGAYAYNFLSWQNLLSHPLFLPFQYWERQLQYGIGWVHCAVIFSSLFLLLNPRKFGVKKSRIPFMMLFFISALISIFLTLPYSNFLWKNSPLQNTLIYPQRFLGLSVFSISILSSYVLSIFSPKQLPRTTLIVIFVLLIFHMPYTTLNKRRDTVFQLNNPLMTTSDVYGEFLPLGIPNDFLVNGQIYSSDPLVQVRSGTAETLDCTQKTASIFCTVKTDTPLLLRFRQFNFSGWKAYGDGKSLPLTTDTDGTILVNTSHPISTVLIVFEKTPLRLWAMIFSVCAFITYILIFIFHKKLITPS